MNYFYSVSREDLVSDLTSYPLLCVCVLEKERERGCWLKERNHKKCVEK